MVSVVVYLQQAFIRVSFSNDAEYSPLIESTVVKLTTHISLLLFFLTVNCMICCAQFVSLRFFSLPSVCVCVCSELKLAITSTHTHTGKHTIRSLSLVFTSCGHHHHHHRVCLFVAAGPLPLFFVIHLSPSTQRTRAYDTAITN